MSSRLKKPKRSDLCWLWLHSGTEAGSGPGSALTLLALGRAGDWHLWAAVEHFQEGHRHLRELDGSSEPFLWAGGSGCTHTHPHKAEGTLSGDILRVPFKCWNLTILRNWLNLVSLPWKIIFGDLILTEGKKRWHIWKGGFRSTGYDVAKQALTYSADHFSGKQFGSRPWSILQCSYSLA